VQSIETSDAFWDRLLDIGADARKVRGALDNKYLELRAASAHLTTEFLDGYRDIFEDRGMQDHANKIATRFVTPNLDNWKTLLGPGGIDRAHTDKLQMARDEKRHFSTLDGYLRMAVREGFETVYVDTYKGSDLYDRPCRESFFVMFNREKGMLLVFETYGG